MIQRAFTNCFVLLAIARSNLACDNAVLTSTNAGSTWTSIPLVVFKGPTHIAVDDGGDVLIANDSSVISLLEHSGSGIDTANHSQFVSVEASGKTFVVATVSTGVFAHQAQSSVASLTSSPQQVTAYPNPSSTVVSISASTKLPTELEIVDITGHLIMHLQNIRGFQTSISVNTLPSGTYSVRQIEADVPIATFVVAH